MDYIRVYSTRMRIAEPIGTVTSSRDLVAVLRQWIGDRDRELFVVAHLDARNGVTALELISQGTLVGAMVHPREVFKSAVAKNSASLILAHNHPSGEPSPSTDDIAITRRLVEAGKLLGIPVLDHVIVTTGAHYSVLDRHPELFNPGGSR